MYTQCPASMLRKHAVCTEEPLNPQEVIFILSCFPSPPVPYLFLSSQVHVLIIHIATGVCIGVSTKKYKTRVPGSPPRMHADNDDQLNVWDRLKAEDSGERNGFCYLVKGSFTLNDGENGL